MSKTVRDDVDSNASLKTGDTTDIRTLVDTAYVSFNNNDRINSKK